VKLCEQHWSQLRADVSKYGLDHLIPPDGRAAVDMIERQFKGTDGALDFDPLMQANHVLWEKALAFVGVRIMLSKEDGSEYCPACELRDYNWVEGAAYQSRLFAEKNGLLLPDVAAGEATGQ
jgi:hypothetical protein